jgi:hypothetical protein
MVAYTESSIGSMAFRCTKAVVMKNENTEIVVMWCSLMEVASLILMWICEARSARRNDTTSSETRHDHPFTANKHCCEIQKIIIITMLMKLRTADIGVVVHQHRTLRWKRDRYYPFLSWVVLLLLFTLAIVYASLSWRNMSSSGGGTVRSSAAHPGRVAEHYTEEHSEPTAATVYYPPAPPLDVLRSRYKNVPHSTIMVLFVLSRQDSYLQQRIAALHYAFGDNLLLIWDSGDTQCPHDFFSSAAATTGDDIVRCVDYTHQSISTTNQYSSKKGLERAAMWAIANRDDLSYVWFLEDDVEYYPDIGELIKVVDGTHIADDLATADLLSHMPFSDPKRNENGEEVEWSWLGTVLRQTAEYDPFENTPIRHAMFNLFRVSSLLLEKMHEFYQRNHDSWAYFEALLPTLVNQHHFHSELWTDYMLQTQNVSAFFRYRPCFTIMDQPGIYHPVKYRNGTYEAC